MRYLPVSSIAKAIDLSKDQLCQGCITGEYPTEHGQRLYNIALQNRGGEGARTYEKVS